MEKVIGSCSNCGGPVTIHTGPWGSIIPPIPTCTQCGATKRGPVIDMDPPRKCHNMACFCDGSCTTNKYTPKVSFLDYIYIS